jgi:hypothetical protein
VTSTVGVIATLTCSDVPAQTWSGNAAVIVAASADRVSVPFDGGLWLQQMMLECLAG